LDSGAQFHEDAFLTAGEFSPLLISRSEGLTVRPATAEFYTSAAHVQSLVDEAESVAGMATDFIDNQLAMRKRMYYIMVEMATLHEQLRSVLIHRSQLVDEGEGISERLRSVQEGPSNGLDMVP
jgi:hypothetical protein